MLGEWQHLRSSRLGLEADLGRPAFLGPEETQGVEELMGSLETWALFSLSSVVQVIWLIWCRSLV